MGMISAFLLTPTPSLLRQAQDRPSPLPEGEGARERDQSHLLIKGEDVQHATFVGVFTQISKGTDCAEGCGWIIG